MFHLHPDTPASPIQNWHQITENRPLVWKRLTVDNTDGRRLMMEERRRSFGTKVNFLYSKSQNFILIAIWFVFEWRQRFMWENIKISKDLFAVILFIIQKEKKRKRFQVKKRRQVLDFLFIILLTVFLSVPNVVYWSVTDIDIDKVLA